MAHSTVHTELVASMTTSALRAESARFHQHKSWCARQVEVDRELAKRATSAWRQEDVFGPGHGFARPEHWDR